MCTGSKWQSQEVVIPFHLVRSFMELGQLCRYKDEMKNWGSIVYRVMEFFTVPQSPDGL
jgi:hypothetical protein